MSYVVDPGLHRDLTEAKAALTRHGIVIIRALETELEPAIMAEVRDSLESSPRKLAQIDEDDLDRFMEQLRKAVEKPSEELRALYTRLLAKLGTDDFQQLAKELEGIDQLFKWERVSRVAEPVNKLLGSKGFKPVALTGPRDVSEDFELEFAERWTSAFDRFKELVDKADAETRRQEAEEASMEQVTKTRKKKR